MSQGPGNGRKGGFVHSQGCRTSRVVGHAALLDGQENARHNHLTCEHPASHCSGPTLWVSRREMQPCAGSYPRCTILPFTTLLLMTPPCPSSTSGERSQLPACFNPCLSTQQCPNSLWESSWGTDPHTWAHTSPSIRVQAAPALLHEPCRICTGAHLPCIHLLPKFSPSSWNSLSYHYAAERT